MAEFILKSIQQKFILNRLIIICLVFQILLSQLSYAQNQDIRYFHPAVSSQGQIAFDSNLDGKVGTYILTKNKGYERVSPKEYSCSHPAWSPDGSKISYESNREGNYDIYVYDFAKGNETRLTFSDSVDAVSQWKSNSTILFESNRDGKFKIYQVDLKELSTPQLMTKKVHPINYPKWSPDEKFVLFSTHFNGDLELCVADADFTTVTRLTKSENIDGLGSWSRDGNLIAFSSKRSGTNEIYLMNKDGSNLKQLTFNTENSSLPCFHPKKNIIIFMSRQEGNPSAIYSINIKNGQQKKLTTLK